MSDNANANANPPAAGEEKLSKSERKRRAKAAWKAEQKAKKEAARAAAKAEKEAEAAANAPERKFHPRNDLENGSYFEYKEDLMKQFEEAGFEVHPHKFVVTHRAAELRAQFDTEELAAGSVLEDVVSIAGRVYNKREASAKLIFYDVYNDGVKVQVLARKNEADETDLSFEDMHSVIGRGDIVGFTGTVGRSKKGELSVFPSKTTLLAPMFHMLPRELTSTETRYRQRHLDLMVNYAEVAGVFKTRAKVIKYIRDFFNARDFVEVETALLHTIAGGATARPFVTHHNNLDIDVYMRIAPELQLKQLIVGGMERVFEIGPQFRNEGLDLTHNATFTTIETYEAYADYHDLMASTEELLSGLVLEVCGSHVIKYKPLHAEEPYTIDFSPPFARVDYLDGLEEALGESIPRPVDSAEAIAFLEAQLEKHEIECPPPHTPARLLDALVGDLMEDKFINPTFLINQPVVASPLAKGHRDQPEKTERFELFVAGKELANAYTELNQPQVQRARFEEQAKAKAAGDDEAQLIDESFLHALECGLPPTGGWGLGIDRLVMVCTNKPSIREVMLYPMMRPLDPASSSAAADADAQ